MPETNAPAVSEKDTYPIRTILRDHEGFIRNSGLFDGEQRKAAACISRCKTGELGLNRAWCPKCGLELTHNCSCNNRNCPCCQYPQQQKWVELRKAEVIPGIPYYHLVLTLPHKLNKLILANEALLLKLLFSASSAAVTQLCQDPRHLGATPGIVSVLHTWSQQLLPHFHVHMIVTGGGTTKDGGFLSLTQFRQKHNRHKANIPAGSFFLPLRALKKLFQGKFMAALRLLYCRNELSLPGDLAYLEDPREWHDFCDILYSTEWVCFLKTTFNGNGNAIEYLARYTFKTAISNGRILQYDGRSVTFRTTNRETQQKVDVTLQAEEFIRRFLTHVLPHGFSRVRYSGFLSNSQKLKRLDAIFRLILQEPFTPSPLKNAGTLAVLAALLHKDVRVCPHCGAAMNFHPRDRPAV